MSGLVRVRVVPDTGDALDLALPGAVLVADLVPELARRAQLSAAVRVVTAGGRELVPGAGLAEQGVADGSVLALVPADEGASGQDDPAEAIAEEVAARVLAWHVRLVRPVVLTVVALLLATGGAALARGPAWCGAVAASAGVLLSGGAGLALRRHDRLVAAAAAWAAVGFAAVAGQQYAGPVTACVAAAGTALVLARALRDVGALMLPALAASVVLGALALLAQGTGLESGLASALGLTGSALLVPALPRLALLLTAGRTVPARELLRAMIAATAVAMVVLAAPTAASGAAGALLAVAVGLLAACRGSRHHGAVEVVSGLATGLLIALVAAVVTLLRQPSWAGAVGIVCLILAAALSVLVLRPSGSGHAGPSVPEADSPRAEGDPRLALAIDRLEAFALVCLVPLLVWVAGVVPLVTDLVGR